MKIVFMLISALAALPGCAGPIGEESQSVPVTAIRAPATVVVGSTFTAEVEFQRGVLEGRGRCRGATEVGQTYDHVGHRYTFFAEDRFKRYLDSCPRFFVDPLPTTFVQRFALPASGIVELELADSTGRVVTKVNVVEPAPVGAL